MQKEYSNPNIRIELKFELKQNAFFSKSIRTRMLKKMFFVCIQMQIFRQIVFFFSNNRFREFENIGRPKPFEHSKNFDHNYSLDLCG